MSSREGSGRQAPHGKAGERGSTIAEQIARFKTGPPVPREQRAQHVAQEKFWWQAQGAAGTSEQATAGMQHAQQDGPTSRNDHVASTDQSKGSETMVLLQELAHSNPALFKELMSMQRDPSGRVSDATMTRIQTALAAAPTSSASSSIAGSINMVVPKGQNLVAPSSPDSPDSLQEALNRYRSNPAQVLSTATSGHARQASQARLDAATSASAAAASPAVDATHPQALGRSSSRREQASAVVPAAADRAAGQGAAAERSAVAVAACATVPLSPVPESPLVSAGSSGDSFSFPTNTPGTASVSSTPFEKALDAAARTDTAPPQPAQQHPASKPTSSPPEPVAGAKGQPDPPAPLQPPLGASGEPKKPPDAGAAGTTAPSSTQPPKRGSGGGSASAPEAPGAPAVKSHSGGGAGTQPPTAPATVPLPDASKAGAAPLARQESKTRASSMDTSSASSSRHESPRRQHSNSASTAGDGSAAMQRSKSGRQPSLESRKSGDGRISLDAGITAVGSAPAHLPPPPQHLEKLYKLATEVAAPVIAAENITSAQAAAKPQDPALVTKPKADASAAVAVPQGPVASKPSAAALPPAPSAGKQVEAVQSQVAAPIQQASSLTFVPPATAAAKDASASALTHVPAAQPTAAAAAPVPTAAQPAPAMAPSAASAAAALAKVSAATAAVAAPPAEPSLGSQLTDAPALTIKPTAVPATAPAASSAAPAQPQSAAVPAPAPAPPAPAPSAPALPLSTAGALRALDVSKGWPADMPHGKPILLPGVAGVRPPMMFVPTTSPAASPPSSPPANTMHPTHIFVPNNSNSPPQLLAFPGHRSFPLPANLSPRSPGRSSSRSPSPQPSPTRREQPEVARMPHPTQAPAPPTGGITFQPPPVPPHLLMAPASEPAKMPEAPASTPVAAPAVKPATPTPEVTSKPKDTAVAAPSVPQPQVPSSPTPAAPPPPAAPAAPAPAPTAEAKPPAALASPASPPSPPANTKAQEVAARRAQDVMEAERKAGYQTTRLTRLVEEVEANRRKQKDLKLLMEEKSKLQKMKWDELEKYLGNQAAAVQEFRALTWEKMTMQREIGTVPPRKLALQFLEQAEAVRGAAIEAAVQRELERAAHEESLAAREAATLHAAMDMQHALALSKHDDSLRESSLLGTAAAAVASSASTWASRFNPGLQQAEAAMAALGVGRNVMDPTWYTSLMAATGAHSPSHHSGVRGSPGAVGGGGRRGGSPPSPSSSSSSSAADTLEGKDKDRRRRKPKGRETGRAPEIPLAAQLAGLQLAHDVSGVSSAIRGSLPTGSHSVDEITRAARAVSLQLDQAVSHFLSNTDKRQGPVGAHDRLGAPGPILVSPALGGAAHSTFTALPIRGGGPLLPGHGASSAQQAQLVASLVMPGGGSAAGPEPTLLQPTQSLVAPPMPGSGMYAPGIMHGSWGHAPGAGLLPGAPHAAQAVLMAQQQAMAAQQAALQAQHQLIAAQHMQVQRAVDTAAAAAVQSNQATAASVYMQQQGRYAEEAGVMPADPTHIVAAQPTQHGVEVMPPRAHMRHSIAATGAPLQALLPSVGQSSSVMSAGEILQQQQQAAAGLPWHTTNVSVLAGGHQLMAMQHAPVLGVGPAGHACGCVGECVCSGQPPCSMPMYANWPGLGPMPGDGLPAVASGLQQVAASQQQHAPQGTGSPYVTRAQHPQQQQTGGGQGASAPPSSGQAPWHTHLHPVPATASSDREVTPAQQHSQPSLAFAPEVAAQRPRTPVTPHMGLDHEDGARQQQHGTPGRHAASGRASSHAIDLTTTDSTWQRDMRAAAHGTCERHIDILVLEGAQGVSSGDGSSEDGAEAGQQHQVPGDAAAWLKARDMASDDSRTGTPGHAKMASKLPWTAPGIQRGHTVKYDTAPANGAPPPAAHRAPTAPSTLGAAPSPQRPSTTHQHHEHKPLRTAPPQQEWELVGGPDQGVRDAHPQAQSATAGPMRPASACDRVGLSTAPPMLAAALPQPSEQQQQHMVYPAVVMQTGASITGVAPGLVDSYSTSYQPQQHYDSTGSMYATSLLNQTLHPSAAAAYGLGAHLTTSSTHALAHTQQYTLSLPQPQATPLYGVPFEQGPAGAPYPQSKWVEQSVARMGNYATLRASGGMPGADVAGVAGGTYRSQAASLQLQGSSSRGGVAPPAQWPCLSAVLPPPSTGSLGGMMGSVSLAHGLGDGPAAHTHTMRSDSSHQGWATGTAHSLGSQGAGSTALAVPAGRAGAGEPDVQQAMRSTWAQMEAVYGALQR